MGEVNVVSRKTTHNMAAHVKLSGKWKDVKINPNIFMGQDFSGFVCMQELADYDVIQSKPVVKKEKQVS